MDQETPAAKSAPGTGSVTDVKLLASQLFNETWRLLELQPRTRQDDDRMIHTAHASRCHWGQVATVTQAQRMLETADPLHWYLAGAAHETGGRREPLWVY